jgi:hypothetical protein
VIRGASNPSGPSRTLLTSETFFFFFTVLGFELRASGLLGSPYHLSHSASLLLTSVRHLKIIRYAKSYPESPTVKHVFIEQFPAGYALNS